MNKVFRSQKGFTLIELVMVIVILAILGAVAVPLYVDLRQDARNAAEMGIAAGVRAGILTFFVDPNRGNRSAYPTNAQVDTAVVGACTEANACFTGVLGQGGITGDWTKLSASTWRSSVNATNVWTYTQGTPANGGTFLKTTT